MTGAADVATRAARLRDELGRSVAVGISGVDCAGKSTFAAEVAARLGEATVLAGDELTRPAGERHRDPDEARGYYRDSFDYAQLFDEVLPAVRANTTATIALRVSDGELDGWRTRTLELRPRTILVVEGCFLFVGDRASAFDLSVWLDLPLERVVERALARPSDLARMGGPDGVRERYTRRYLPGQALHIQGDEPQRRVDLVVPAE